MFISVKGDRETMAPRAKAKPVDKAGKKTEKTPKKPASKVKAKGATDKDVQLDFSSLGLDSFTLTEREKRFVYYYTLPGTDAFMNQSRAAEMAGYKGKYPHTIGYHTRRRPEVDAAIKSILSSRVSINLEEKYQKALEMLDQRAFYNLAEYVKQKTMTVKVGKDEWEEIEYEGFKDLSELTPEQLKAIDGIDYRGVNGTRVFIMADRVKTLVDIINMRNKVNGGGSDDDFDVDATAEIIKSPQEQLAVKLTLRKKKEVLSHDAGYIKAPKEQTVEEL
jgi:hypothetical protein